MLKRLERALLEVDQTRTEALSLAFNRFSLFLFELPDIAGALEEQHHCLRPRRQRQVAKERGALAEP